MCCCQFWTGMGLGLTVGICVGTRVKINERKIRRAIHRTARNVENAFDSMSH